MVEKYYSNSYYVHLQLSLGLVLVFFVHLDVASEHNIPELAAYAKANRTKFVVVLHVVQFHVLEITVLGRTVVHEVVHFIVNLVTDKPAKPNCVEY